MPPAGFLFLDGLFVSCKYFLLFIYFFLKTLSCIVYRINKEKDNNNQYGGAAAFVFQIFFLSYSILLRVFEYCMGIGMDCQGTKDDDTFSSV
jgi:hypothetical protein